jgi:hypothetical protein
VKPPRFGVSVLVVADLLLDLDQFAAALRTGLTRVELDLHRPADLLERDLAPPFSVFSRCLCSARYKRLTDVSTKWRIRPM